MKTRKSTTPVDPIVMLPCPFCGSDPYVSEDDDGMSRWVSCSGCESDGPPLYYKFPGSPEEARQFVIKAWNQRVK